MKTEGAEGRKEGWDGGRRRYEGRVYDELIPSSGSMEMYIESEGEREKEKEREREFLCLPQFRAA